MTVYPMAILKFCWSDAPFAGEGPSERNIDDNVVNRLFLPLSPWWSVAGYWQGTSFDTIQMEANEVFPWRRLEGFPKPTTANQYDRRQVIPKAVEQALAEGWPLDQFKGIVVWMPLGGAPSQDGGGRRQRMARLPAA